MSRRRPKKCCKRRRQARIHWKSTEIERVANPFQRSDDRSTRDGQGRSVRELYQIGFKCVNRVELRQKRLRARRWKIAKPCRVIKRIFRLLLDELDGRIPVYISPNTRHRETGKYHVDG